MVDMLDMEFELSSIISLMKMSEEFKVPFISKEYHVHRTKQKVIICMKYINYV
ncbi:hypothetical protein LQK80_18935 [Bacillus thuringiensis]|nr:hypothetical protein [Bacillus thuringiensis]